MVVDVNGLTNRTLSSLRGGPTFVDFIFKWYPRSKNMAPGVIPVVSGRPYVYVDHFNMVMEAV